MTVDQLLHWVPMSPKEMVAFAATAYIESRVYKALDSSLEPLPIITTTAAVIGLSCLQPRVERSTGGIDLVVTRAAVIHRLSFSFQKPMISSVREFTLENEEITLRESLRSDIGTERIRNLLQRGLDPNKELPIGQASLLSYAAASGSSEHVRVLLEARADVNAVDKFNRTALLIATQAIETNYPEYLGNPEDQMRSQALRYRETVRVLIGARADVNFADSDGMTALSSSCVGGSNPYKRREITRLILEAGVEPNIDNRTRGLLIALSPLSKTLYFNQYGNNEIIADLIQAGADVNAQFRPGLAYQLARRVSYYIKPSGTGFLSIPGGRAPLHFAAKHNNEIAIRTLLTAGADPMVQDDEGSYPFMLSTNPEVRGLLAFFVSEQVETG